MYSTELTREVDFKSAGTFERLDFVDTNFSTPLVGNLAACFHRSHLAILDASAKWHDGLSSR